MIFVHLFYPFSMLGATQLGLVFGEDFAFFGAEYKVNDAAEHEVDYAVEKWSTKVDCVVDIRYGIWA